MTFCSPGKGVCPSGTKYKNKKKIKKKNNGAPGYLYCNVFIKHK